MNKVEILKNVRKRIEEKGVIQCGYVEGNCMCAVGYMLDECGVDMKIFVEDSEMNYRNIRSVVARNDNIHNKICEAGLWTGDLAVLQGINDGIYDEKIRVEKLLNKIDELINNS